MAEAFGTVQFPGGHLKDKEELKNGLIRELEEETGMIIKEVNEPYFGIKHYLKDYPVIGNNRSVEIYYFLIKTNQKYDLNNIKLDDQERNGEFELYYLPLKEINKHLKENESNNPINKVINKEMLLALKFLRKKEIK